MMALLLKIVVIWLSSSILIMATSWYAKGIIQLYWPDWWNREVVGCAPESEAY